MSKGRVLRMAEALARDPSPRGDLFRALLERIYTYTKDMKEFTSDDLREFPGIERILEDLKDPRYLGLALRWLENRGLIKKTDIMVPTKRAKAHARPIRVYRVIGGTLVLPYPLKDKIREKYEKLDAAKLGVIPLDHFGVVEG